MARTITLRPPAKINLTLGVGATRADGFHDVHTILQTIALSDTLTAAPRRGPFSLTITAQVVPADRTNLVWRAADALWRAAGRKGDPRDVQVTLRKAIPMAAGLGGGSSDAAATLVALNRVWNLRLGRAELMRVAATLGADVPFFLIGGTAIGLGRGDEVYPLQDIAHAGIVVIKPSVGVSTRDAYRWLDEDRAERTGAASVSSAGPQHAITAWPSRPLVVANDFGEAIGRRHAEVADAISACTQAGAVAAALCGSGSAVFGVFSLAKVAKAARRLGRPGWTVFATRTLSRAEASRRMSL